MKDRTFAGHPLILSLPRNFLTRPIFLPSFPLPFPTPQSSTISRCFHPASPSHSNRQRPSPTLGFATDAPICNSFLPPIQRFLRKMPDSPLQVITFWVLIYRISPSFGIGSFDTTHTVRTTLPFASLDANMGCARETRCGGFPEMAPPNSFNCQPV